MITFNQLTQAMPAIQILSELKLPVRQSYTIFKLIKLINEQKEFLIQKEKELVEKYGGTVSEIGEINFGDNQDGKLKFIQERIDLYNLEIETAISFPITLSLDSIEGEKLSPTEMMALDGIINFE